jgi:REP element-mobilizing transposase RayT
LYHIVCPAKYRRAVIDKEVDKKVREVCLGIEARYEIRFVEIEKEMDQVHFLVQSVPKYSPEQIVRTIKSIRAKKIFELCPKVKKMLWGGEFWTRGYYVGGQEENREIEKVIQQYIMNQGRNPENYQKTHEGKQLGVLSYQNKA